MSYEYGGVKEDVVRRMKCQPWLRPSQLTKGWGRVDSFDIGGCCDCDKENAAPSQ